MRVYRLENAQHQGPYSTLEIIDAWSADLDSQSVESEPDRQPLPPYDGFDPHKGREFSAPDYIQDKATIGARSMVYGFKSLAALSAWFVPQELMNLHKIGFKIKEFEVPKTKVWVGKHQLEFSRFDAKLKAEINIREFLETHHAAAAPSTANYHRARQLSEDA
jgi:hypothetical protein